MTASLILAEALFQRTTFPGKMSASLAWLAKQVQLLQALGIGCCPICTHEKGFSLMATLLPHAWWMFVTVQILGFASAWITRVCLGTTMQRYGHQLFFTALALIGVATFLSVMHGSGWWLLSGLNMATMVIMAVVDGRSPARQAY